MRSRIPSILLLPALDRYGDLALLLLRLVLGAFLVWGVSDNVFNAKRMAEFELFLMQYGFPFPWFMAPLSVWVQFIAGLSFIGGALARWAGILCAINFIVAIAMVDIHGGIRAMFPSASLIVAALYLATHGAGRFSIDHVIESRVSRGS